MRRIRVDFFFPSKEKKWRFDQWINAKFFPSSAQNVFDLPFDERNPYFRNVSRPIKKKKEIVTWRSIQSMNYGQRRYSRASEYQYNETNLFLMMSMGEKLVLNILYRWKIDCEYQNRNKNWYTITMDRDLFIIF